MKLEITKDLIINQIYKFTESDLKYLESVSKVFSEFGSYIPQSDIDNYEFDNVYVYDNLEDLLDRSLGLFRSTLIELLWKINYFKIDDHLKVDITEHLVLTKDCVYLPLENLYLNCNIGDLIIMIDIYNGKVLSIDPSYTIKLVVHDDEIYTM